MEPCTLGFWSDRKRKAAIADRAFELITRDFRRNNDQFWTRLREEGDNQAIAGEGARENA